MSLTGLNRVNNVAWIYSCYVECIDTLKSLSKGMIMGEFTDILCHARRFKSNVKGLSIEQLEDVKTKLEKIIEDRSAEMEELEKQEAERQEQIKKIQEMCIANGIDIDELQGAGAAQKRKRAPREPKYQVKGDDGEQITWTGQGRMPNVLKKRVEKGEKLESFLIKK